jgi:hypothetical protein
MRLAHSSPASTHLLDDLRSDLDMGWVPSAAWLTKVEIDGPADLVTHDLAISPDGVSAPSRVDAGYDLTPPTAADAGITPAALVRVLLTLGFVGVGIALIALLTSRRPASPAA